MKLLLRLRKRMLQIAVIALAISSPVGAQQGGPGYGPHMWGGGSSMFFGPMMMFIVIAVIVMIRESYWDEKAATASVSRCPR